MFRQILTEVIKQAVEASREGTSTSPVFGGGSADPVMPEGQMVRRVHPADQYPADQRPAERVFLEPVDPEKLKLEQVIAARRIVEEAPRRSREGSEASERRGPLPRPVAQAGPTMRMQSQLKEVQRVEILEALGTRSGIRRALVLQEIIGPPRSIRGWEDAY